MLKNTDYRLHYTQHRAFHLCRHERGGERGAREQEVALYFRELQRGTVTNYGSHYHGEGGGVFETSMVFYYLCEVGVSELNTELVFLIAWKSTLVASFK